MRASSHRSNVETAGVEDHDVVVKTTPRDIQEQGNAVSAGGDQNPASKAVQNTALDYIRSLRKQNPEQYERPQVTLMEKNAGECHPIQVIKEAAREQLKEMRQVGRTLHEGSLSGTEQVQPPAKAHSAGLRTAEASASSALSLPPCDSPLTKVFLGQYLSKLVQETITYRKTRYSDLAREMSIPEMVLQDAIQGKLALTRGQWVKVGQLLKLPTTFELRASELHGKPCWELCYPPIGVGQPMQWW